MGNHRDFAADRQFNLSQRNRLLFSEVLLASSAVIKPGPVRAFKSIPVTHILSLQSCRQIPKRFKLAREKNDGCISVL